MLDGAQSDVPKISDSNGQVSCPDQFRHRSDASSRFSPPWLLSQTSRRCRAAFRSRWVYRRNSTSRCRKHSQHRGLRHRRNEEHLQHHCFRSTGQPVPAGTSINFIAEAARSSRARSQPSTAAAWPGRPRTSISSSPRPADGRTMRSPMRCEESFIDLNGTNGPVTRSRTWAISISIATTTASITPTTINSSRHRCPAALRPARQSRRRPSPCVDWMFRFRRSRRIRAMWDLGGAPMCAAPSRPYSPSTPSGLADAGGSCIKDTLIVGYDAAETPITAQFYPLAGTALTDPSRSYSFYVSDANGQRINPMAAGTIISIGATTGTNALLLGGSPVPSTTDVSVASFSYGFATGVTGGTVTLTFTSPSGLATSASAFPSLRQQAARHLSSSWACREAASPRSRDVCQGPSPGATSTPMRRWSGSGLHTQSCSSVSAKSDSERSRKRSSPALPASLMR